MRDFLDDHMIAVVTGITVVILVAIMVGSVWMIMWSKGHFEQECRALGGIPHTMSTGNECRTAEGGFIDVGSAR